MNFSRSSSFRHAIATLAGTVLLGFGSAVFASPPPHISVQVATPGVYVGFATGPRWMPGYAYPVAPVVPVYVPGYAMHGPAGYWYPPPRVVYRHSGHRDHRHGGGHDHHGDRRH